MAPAITRANVYLPPGTSEETLGADEPFESLSDQDIAAGSTPKSTRTGNKRLT